MNLRFLLFLIMILAYRPYLFAQDKCATVEVSQKRRDKALLLESDNVFEEWIGKAKAKVRPGRVGGYTVPVVVHIIHKNEPVGTGTNLSVEQIQSQLDVLNRDFNRTNPDASQTPSEFQSVAGQIEIEFVLAKQDPDGNVSDGIVRVRGAKSTWTISDEETLKATSYWPAENYLNIWVADLSSSLLGYAQFPVSDLSGMESAVNNRITDGVVIDYTVFGCEDFGAFNLNSDFRKGRTTTHEVGHFFGLRHIWGDDNGACSGSGDYVADTPDQGNNTSGCLTHPQTSCSAHKMFQNYMDYTNDDCMNLFTQGQVSRMITVLENSPRRLSLLSSPGASEPTPAMNSFAIVSNDLGRHECAGIHDLNITVINDGINSITSAKFRLTINNDTREQSVLFDIPLPSEAVTKVNLGNVVIQSGTNKLLVQVVSINESPDDEDDDNILESSCYAFFATTLPFDENFDSMPALWHEDDVAGNIDWAAGTAANVDDFNSALMLNFFGSASLAASNFLFTPAFDLTSSDKHYLVFDVAYAQSASTDNDGLKIYLFSDCGNDPVETGVLIYDKNGKSLSSTSISSTAFVPLSPSHWRQEIVDISSFSGKQNVRFALRGINDQGNNVYVDNVHVTQEVVENVSIVNLERPGPVHCDTAATPVINLKNNGTSTIQSLTVVYDVDGDAKDYVRFSEMNMSPGEVRLLSLPHINLQEGANTLTVELTRPNDLFDVVNDDNVLSVQSFVDRSTDLLPLRQDFEKDAWVVSNPGGPSSWELITTNFGQSEVRLKPAEAMGESWIVSPVLDFSYVAHASLYFNIAILDNVGVPKTGASLSSTDYGLKVSTDCGVTYQSLTTESVPAIHPDLAINETGINPGWLTMYASLTPFHGQSSVRIAFVVPGTSELEAYLDNIEVFLSDGVDLVAADRPFSLYDTDPGNDGDLRVTFNLAERRGVNLAFIDMTGRVVEAGSFDNILNQTLTLEPALSSGIYLLKIMIGTQTYTSRVLLTR
jgi:hypothetical protein